MPVRKLEQTLMVSLPGRAPLHMRRLTDNPDGPPVLALHGLLDDGTLFYPQEGQGLAHYLAQHGFDVYVPDFHGPDDGYWMSRTHWLSCRVSDVVTLIMPAILETIQSLRGLMPVYWFVHGWSGTMANHFLVHYPGYRSTINGLIYFGVHRASDDGALSRRVWADGLLTWSDSLLDRLRGLISGRLRRAGLRREFLGIPLDSFSWLQGQSWQDIDASFDYGHALSKGLDYPPALYFASRKDLGYCTPQQVRAFMNEVSARNGRLVILGRREGNLHDYSHREMLTHHDAVRDHFPFMVNWIEEMSRLRYEAIHGDDPHDNGTQRSSARGR